MSPLCLHWLTKGLETLAGNGLCLALGQQNWICCLIPLIIRRFSMLMELGFYQRSQTLWWILGIERFCAPNQYVIAHAPLCTFFFDSPSLFAGRGVQDEMVVREV